MMSKSKSRLLAPASGPAKSKLDCDNDWPAEAFFGPVRSHLKLLLDILNFALVARSHFRPGSCLFVCLIWLHPRVARPEWAANHARLLGARY